MISPPTLVWGAADWLVVAMPLVGALLFLLTWGYLRGGASATVRLVAAALKFIGVLILAACLLEPLFSGSRARPGANLFIVLADNSRSMTLADRDSPQSRAQQLTSLAKKDSPWLTRVGQDFDLRTYAFDTQLRAAENVEAMAFDGTASRLASSLQKIQQRYQGRPVAGIIVLSDGNATDFSAVESLLAGAKLPPVFPVLLGSEKSADDISLDHVTVTQTNFEDSPVTLAAQVVASGYGGRTVVANLLDESGKQIQQQKITIDADGQPQTVRFRLKPEQAGVSFFRISMDAEDSLEATRENNSRLVAVDRGKGPYRVLYVGGRPNWEYKFLQRSIVSDDQLQLVGLLRIARREPKFTYLGHLGEATNPLFRGFEGADPEQVEEYDQPVLARLGTESADELRGGFPKSAEDLYRYHTIILDDVESEFFTQDQMQLVKEFVRQRGGGLLMLGGVETFAAGKYDRTPIGDLLPVYADQVAPVPADARFHISLTREGWLEPWVRLRAEEDAEQKRLQAMPAFQTVNQIRGIKPGATVLANATLAGGGSVPALVEQRFGHGRAAAMLVGDLWRWSLRRSDQRDDDLGKSWRQMIRWLVADVPQRLEMAVEPRSDDETSDSAVTIAVKVRDPAYEWLDNAAVTILLTAADGKTLSLPAEPSQRQPGLYEAVYVPRQAGAYRAEARVIGPDSADLGKVQAGWASDPAADEFRQLAPNRALLERIATATGGQMVDASDLETFAASLPNRHAEITEPYVRPMWHQPWIFLLAIACLTAEWGLRRWKGMP